MADVSVTAATVAVSSPTNPALRKSGTSGVALLAGQSVSKAADGRIVLFDANAASPANVLEGVMLCSCPGANQPCWYATVDSDFVCGFTTAVGTTYVGSNTPGGICPIADLTTNDAVNYIGTGKASNKLDLNVDPTGITKA